MRKFKSLEDALRYYEEQNEFIPEILLTTEEYDDYLNADVSYTLKEYAVDKDINLDDRKIERIQFLVEDDEIEVKGIYKCDYLAEKCSEIEELEEKLKDLPSEKYLEEDLFYDAYGEFVEEFHCSYDFTECGLDLLNSYSEDMEWTIEDFVKSGCKNWKEFSLYLADRLISIYNKYLNE